MSELSTPRTARRPLTAAATVLALAAAGLTAVAAPAHATGSDLLLGASYTASVAADPGYPDSGGELTDGLAGGPYISGSGWQARGSMSSYSFTADLGTATSVGSYSANFFVYTGAGIALPTLVEFETSVDGVTWAPACSVSTPSAGAGPASVPFACDAGAGATVRWLRMLVTTPTSWSFIDEWEAFAPAPPATPAISGSFLQPPLADTWTSTEWDTELGYLTRAGLEDLALNWTADSKRQTTVYPTSLPGYTQSTTEDVVGGALDAADGAGMDVYLGLQINDDWWVKHADDAGWLEDEAQASIDIAEELWDGYGTHDSFAGWYLPFEVDNWNFTTSTSWANLADYYATVADALHLMTPGLPVVISPFINPTGGMDSSDWADMWESVLGSADIDVFALQDGVGGGHVTTGELPEWFEATRDGIQAGRPATQFWANTETFNRDMQPMGVAMMTADMAAEAPFVTRFWSFAYDHYLSPQQVNPSYDATYRDYLATGAVEAVAPTTPTGLTATATGPLTITLGWTASTDAYGVMGYRIYRDGDVVRNIYGAGVALVDDGLDPSTSHVYAVQAFDAAGNLSAVSATASATTPAGPSNPTNLAAGANYTSSLAADVVYPDGGGELTDGVFAPTSYWDAAWQGRNTGSAYSFVVDLGSVQTVEEISTRSASSCRSGSSTRSPRPGRDTRRRARSRRRTSTRPTSRTATVSSGSRSARGTFASR